MKPFYIFLCLFQLILRIYTFKIYYNFHSFNYVTNAVPLLTQWLTLNYVLIGIEIIWIINNINTKLVECPVVDKVPLLSSVL